MVFENEQRLLECVIQEYLSFFTSNFTFNLISFFTSNFGVNIFQCKF